MANRKPQMITIEVPAVWDVPTPRKIRATTDQASVRVTLGKNPEGIILSAIANGLRQKLGDTVAKTELQGEEALARMNDTVVALNEGVWARGGGGKSLTPLEREMKNIAELAAERHLGRRSGDEFKNTVLALLSERHDDIKAKAEANLSNAIDLDLDGLGD